VTAKETLIERVSELSEDEAAWLLAQLEDAADYVPLTPEDVKAINRGIAQLDAGLGVSQDEVERRFGLAP
jgi:predicted transcriptional regulator